MNKMEKDTGLNPRSCRDDIFPHWGQPYPVGYFSVDADRFYLPGHSNLRYYRPPNRDMFPLDLNTGFGTAKSNTGSRLDEGIDRLLRFIFDNYSSVIGNLDKKYGEKPSERQKNPFLPIEFVSWRGLLRVIMRTPFEYRNKWILRATRYKGTFYLSEVETDESKRDRLNQSEQRLRMCSWGYKFEQYCLASSPDAIPNTRKPVDECSEFSVVFHTKLEEHNLLFGAEIDGIQSHRKVHLNPHLPLDELEFIELKTSCQIMNERQRHSLLSYKIRDWWCQAFFVGINEIIVGWRDENGFVWNIQRIPVNQLPKKAKNWNPNKCAWFLVMFLNCLKSLMAGVDSPHTVWEFEYHASNSFITYKVFEGCTEKSFLPDYYIQFMENLSKTTEDD